MKKIIIASAFALVAVAGLVMLSDQPKAQDVVPDTTAMVPCHYPEQPDCPLTAEQEAATDIPHPISEETMKSLEEDYATPSE